jgi:hypothetical protein
MKKYILQNVKHFLQDGSRCRAGTCRNIHQENTIMKTPLIYYCAIAVFCLLTFLAGFASAADTAQSGAGGAGIPGPAYRHTHCWYQGAGLNNAACRQQFKTGSGQTGTDVTCAGIALRNTATAAVKAWHGHELSRPPFHHLFTGQDHAALPSI